MKSTYFFVLTAFCFSQAYAYNLPQQTIKSYPCEDCSKLSHENLHAHWNIAALPLNSHTALDQKSYSYNLKVSAKELQQGITLATRAPGAIVRITPLEKNSVPELELKTPQNQSLSLKDASVLSIQDEALTDSFMTAQHQSIIQLKPELGFGNFVLQSQKSTPQEANSYMVHVFDKFSLIYLQVEPDATHYHYGDPFNAIISLKDNDTDYSIDEINATLIGPDDQHIPLELTRIKRNQFRASTILSSEKNPQGDNWYVEAEVFSEQNDATIRRTVRTAFSYSIPSAGLLNIKKISSTPLTFSASVDVATASRYTLQSVLYHKNAQGNMVPVETAQSAQWLEPGKQNIKFSFDNSQQLSEDTLAVGYLHLTDYGQLKTVYQYDQPIKLSQLMD